MLDLIIPFYNSKTLDKTLASILYQTDTDINIYLIDDCSTISYKKTIDFYKDKLNIKYYKLKNNGGPGVARQYGIEHSNAPFIMFMDSDDSFGSYEAIEKIKSLIKENEFDLLVSTFVEELENGVYFHVNDEIWLHGKVYRRGFLENNNVHFNDTRKNEDNFFNQLMLLHNPRIYRCDYPLYIYRNNTESITRSDVYKYKYEGDIWYAYNISEAMRECTLDNCDPYKIASIGFRSLIALYFYTIELKNEDLTELYEYSRRIYRLTNFDVLPQSDKEIFLRNHLSYMIDKDYSVLLMGGPSFEDFLKGLGEDND